MLQWKNGKLKATASSPEEVPQKFTCDIVRMNIEFKDFSRKNCQHKDMK